MSEAALDDAPALFKPAPAAAAVATLFEPGVVYGMPFASYRAIEALSQSGAQKINRSAAHYMLDRIAPAEPSDTMLFGSAVHCGVLEPHEFPNRYAAAPACDKRTKDGKAIWAEFCEANRGRAFLSAEQHARAQRCIDAVRAHPSAMRLLDGAEVEVSLFWNDGKHKVPCKARLDARNRGGIFDLKTTADASREEFAKSIARFNYHMQAAHYFSGAEHALDATPNFFAIIAVESERPHAVACYLLPSAAILAGAHLMARALERYAMALATGEWPAYPTNIETIELPRWALRFDY